MIMSDENWRQCCPLLRWAAEVDDLTEYGLIRDNFDEAALIVVGRLRQRYGCPGPGRYLDCPWLQRLAPRITHDHDVPWLRRPRDDGRKSPGQML
jgi:hypothetical protein